jgi:hypothetical protein
VALTGRVPTFRRRDELNVIVPVDAPCQYDDLMHLRTWSKVPSPVASGAVVDAIEDWPVSPNFETHWSLFNQVTSAAWTTAGSTAPCNAPILGLIAQSASAAREIQLVAYGEPWSGLSTSAGDAFDVRLFTGVPNALAGLYAGPWSATPVSLPPCNSWLAGTANSWVTTMDAFGMALVAVPLPPGAAHFEFGLQAWVQSQGGGFFLSNGLHIRVGGDCDQARLRNECYVPPGRWCLFRAGGMDPGANGCHQSRSYGLRFTAPAARFDRRIFH